MENYIVVFDGEEEIELDLQEDDKSLSIETIKAQCGPKATGLLKKQAEKEVKIS